MLRTVRTSADFPKWADAVSATAPDYVCSIGGRCQVRDPPYLAYRLHGELLHLMSRRMKTSSFAKTLTIEGSPNSRGGRLISHKSQPSPTAIIDHHFHLGVASRGSASRDIPGRTRYVMRGNNRHEEKEFVCPSQVLHSHSTVLHFPVPTVGASVSTTWTCKTKLMSVNHMP